MYVMNEIHSPEIHSSLAVSLCWIFLVLSTLVLQAVGVSKRKENGIINKIEMKCIWISSREEFYC